METIATTDTAPTVSRAVVEAVAECHGIDPKEIDTPLGSIVDGDSLNRLWNSPNTSGEEANWFLTFEYYDCQVTITSDDEIEVSLQE